MEESKVFEFKNYEWKVKAPTGKIRKELKNMAGKLTIEENKNPVMELNQGDIEIYNFCNRLEYLKKDNKNIELTKKSYEDDVNVFIIEKIINSINEFDKELEAYLKK